MKKTDNTKKVALYTFAVMLFLIGLAMYLYPIYSISTSDGNTQKMISEFQVVRKNVQAEQGDSSPNDESKREYSELYEAMQKYNLSIYQSKQTGISDAWSFEQPAIDLSEYGYTETVVGVLRVPAMNDLHMPILLGASRANMAKGATQLGQTSMPIGGVNTNCVIAGHRGWNGAKYFIDIEKLKIGDPVYIDNLWETLEYRVCDIKILKPSDIDAVLIQEGRDMVTLFTCHPFRTFNRRYAVFCERVNDKTGIGEGTSAIGNGSGSANVELPTDFKSSEDSIMLEEISYYAVPIVLLLLTAVLALIKKKKAVAS